MFLLSQISTQESKLANHVLKMPTIIQVVNDICVINIKHTIRVSYQLSIHILWWGWAFTSGEYTPAQHMWPLVGYVCVGGYLTSKLLYHWGIFHHSKQFYIFSQARLSVNDRKHATVFTNILRLQWIENPHDCGLCVMTTTYTKDYAHDSSAIIC